MPDAPRPIVVIVGPTAGGKTELAIGLARRLPGGGECICADSMQVYRGMDIGTAKPDAEQRATVPHHLLDLADPAGDDFSVDRWLALAEEAIEDVRRGGRWPIVVGGTNLYVQALLKGLCDGPGPDPALRLSLAEMDDAERRAALEAADPALAERIHPNDLKRTIRALEVHASTGRPLSAMQREWARREIRPDAIIVGLEWPVEAINRRINARVRAMMDAGLLEEVRTLHARGGPGPQAREALGYRQLGDHLEGRITLEEAVERTKIATRRFGKQQRTWLRRFRAIPGSVWLPAGELRGDALLERALEGILRPAPGGS